MTCYTVRRAERADAGAIAEIEKLSFTDPWTEGMILSEMTEGIEFTLLLDGERIIGYSIVDFRVEDEAELHNIAIVPEYRGRGLASLLMDKMLADAGKRSVGVIFLEVRSGNTAARALYKKYGFTELSVRRNYYRSPIEDAVIMQWTDKRMQA